MPHSAVRQTFSDATFKGKGVADFRRVTFNEKADFENVRFEPELKVLFSEELEINKLRHKNWQNCIELLPNLLRRQIFEEPYSAAPAEFNGAELRAHILGAPNLQKKGKFIVADFREEADFKGTIFFEYAYFTGARFHEMAWFIGEDGKYYSMEEGEKDTSNTRVVCRRRRFQKPYFREGCGLSAQI